MCWAAQGPGCQLLPQVRGHCLNEDGRKAGERHKHDTLGCERKETQSTEKAYLCRRRSEQAEHVERLGLAKEEATVEVAQLLHLAPPSPFTTKAKGQGIR